MIYILHIDTSTDTGCVALACDGVIVAKGVNTDSRNHAATINLLIADVLARAGISLPQIHAIAVCAGPGSYTGLRIGVATAKGICYALGKPLMLHNRLTLLNWDAYSNKSVFAENYAALLYARDKEYFIAVHDQDFNCLVEPRHIEEKELPELMSDRNCFLTTDVTVDILNTLNLSTSRLNDQAFPGINTWAIYALDSYKCNNTVNLSLAEPFYLKQVYTHK